MNSLHLSEYVEYLFETQIDYEDSSSSSSRKKRQSQTAVFQRPGLINGNFQSFVGFLLDGMKIGVTRGTAGDQFVLDVRKVVSSQDVAD